MIYLTLPFPISTNALYKNKLKGRAKSQRYMTWLNAAGWDLKRQKQQLVRGWYKLSIVLREADKRKRDPDNAIKCISDLLVMHGLIDDDSKCVELNVQRTKAQEAGCTVFVHPSNGIPDEAVAGRESEMA